MGGVNFVKKFDETNQSILIFNASIYSTRQKQVQ